MTSETITQDDFLRRFAEALGWEVEVYTWSDEGYVKPSWSTAKRYPLKEVFADPRIMAYLVERARAEGFCVTITCPPRGSAQTHVVRPEGDILMGRAIREDVALAPALAVCKALFPEVPLPEGVE